MGDGREANEILDGLWLGPMPASQESAGHLAEHCGVTGLLSLQTDVDLLGWGFEWRQMSRMLGQAGIVDARRVPIVDFSENALAGQLPQAVAALAALRQEHRSTYVHCTAGVNRAPTVTIAYLVAHESFTLDQAWDWVQDRRPVMPLRDALERWLEDESLLPPSSTTSNSTKEDEKPGGVQE